MSQQPTKEPQDVTKTNNPHRHQPACTRPSGDRFQRAAPSVTDTPLTNETPTLPPPEWEFSQLAGPHSEIYIRLGNTVYRLRRTRNGRLILYK